MNRGKVKRDHDGNIVEVKRMTNPTPEGGFNSLEWLIALSARFADLDPDQPMQVKVP